MRTKAEREALKRRVVDAARKNQECTYTDMAERFGLRREKVADWCHEAGVYLLGKHNLSGPVLARPVDRGGP